MRTNSATFPQRFSASSVVGVRSARLERSSGGTAALFWALGERLDGWRASFLAIVPYKPEWGEGVALKSGDEEGEVREIW